MRQPAREIDEVNAAGGDVARRKNVDLDVLSQDACQQDHSVSAVALVESGVLEGEKFDNWICRLLQTPGLHIFWMKGILNIASEDCRFLCQSVRMLFERSRDRPWQANEIRKNELVFIGCNLDEAKLREDFRASLIWESDPSQL